MSDPGFQTAEFAELVDVLLQRLAKDGQSDADVAAQSELAKVCLEAIVSSGFQIQRVSDQTIDRTQTATVAAVAGLDASASVSDLLRVWRQFSGAESAGPAELYTEIGERVLQCGEPLLAYDILWSGLQYWPGNVRLRQLGALALARSGAPRRAATWLTELMSEGHQDEETLGLLARTSKDVWETETDAAKKTESLREAYRLYRRGYEQAVEASKWSGAIYDGINAATTAFLLGDVETATSLADSVSTICRDRADSDADYWSLATLGECAVISGDLVSAAAHYSAAVKLAGRNYANIASTRRNASMLLRHVGEDSQILAEWFPVPRVAVFSGHMTDIQGQPLRFAHSQIDAVQTRLASILRETQTGFGFSAAACGGDLLFLQALQEVGGESHIVLPLPEEQFIESSIAVDAQRDWLPDFRHAMEIAAHVSVVNDYSRVARPVHFEYANQVMTGLAALHAHSLGTEVIPIVVWDEQPSRGPGGTGSVVQLWRKLGWEPRIINPLKLPTESISVPAQSATLPSTEETTTAEEFDMDIRAMLFADVVGYSKLTEEEIPLFVRDFMGSIGECIRESGVSIESCNTWGDALYFVFRTVEEAGLTALQITEHVNSVDWKSQGFNERLRLRTGLHIGPVYRVTDPVTGQPNHSGAHVSRAARIEPVTPPGEVYASEAFAAVATTENVTGFRCDYVGVTPMAKGYGDFPTYHVRRVDSA